MTKSVDCWMIGSMLLDCLSTTVPLGGIPSLDGLQLRKICET